MNAVIIPTYGAWDVSERCIRSASANTPDPLIVVIDDASNDWPGEDVIASWVAPGVPYVIQRYDSQGGLSRSWNRGLSVAKGFGCRLAVCANSDLVFPSGWFDGIAEALESSPFAGPVTNAPGHQPLQRAEAWLLGYRPDGSDEAIQAAADRCRSRKGALVGTHYLNGFCVCGRVESFFECAREGAEVFSKAFPMAGNEDDFFRRAISRSRFPVVVPRSFVFHYRGMSRGLTGRSMDAGFWRGDHGEGCSPCEAGAKIRATKADQAGS